MYDYHKFASEKQALATIERLATYWQGRSVQFRIEPVRGSGGCIMGYAIRSNLVNGLPPGALPDEPWIKLLDFNRRLG